MTTVWLTILALVAFAANSVFSRLALAEQWIDAAGFTMVRLVTGALVLLLLLYFNRLPSKRALKATSPMGSEAASSKRGSWLAALMLFVYAVAFSYAYLQLETGSGALVLFGMVQLTMVVATFVEGHRLRGLEVIGILIAFAGLVYLVLPQVSTPSIMGVVLMALAGMAWAGYTLLGRGSNAPLADTSFNFLRTVPMAVLLGVVALDQWFATPQGLLLAALSGGLASGVGYSIWYRVLRHLSATQAGVLQLLVPVIAAIGGVLFVAEPLTMRLIISASLILGGIYLVIQTKAKTA